MTIDIESAVAYNRKRPYTQEQWVSIHLFLGMDVPSTLASDLLCEWLAWYQERHDLVADGKLGPQTERHMVEHGLVLHRHAVNEFGDCASWCLACSANVDAGRTPEGGYDAARAVAWAQYETDAWRSMTVGSRRIAVREYWGTKDKPRSNWCGAFVASALEAGGVTVPPNTRRGAKRLTRWVAWHGRWGVSPEHVEEYVAAPIPGLVRAGDVLCWNRGTLAGLLDGQVPWQGHVALVLDVRNDGALDIAEGNVRDKTGKRGQLVRRILGPDEWPHRRKDGLKGLYGVARP